MSSEIARVGIPTYERKAHHHTFVATWSHIHFDRPVPLVMRREIQPGDLVQSSHGYKLYVTKVRFKAGDQNYSVTLAGEIHGKGGKERSEIADGHATIPLIERDGVNFLEVGTDGYIPVPKTEPGQILPNGAIVNRVLTNEHNHPEGHSRPDTCWKCRREEAAKMARPGRFGS